MPLTDIKIRQAKPGQKSIKLPDGAGLYLEIKPNGSKLWRYRYKIDGKENLYAVGEYPQLSLQDARKSREEARELVKQGLHPSHVRKSQKDKQIGENANTLQAIASEWIDKKRGSISPYYLNQIETNLKNDVFPFIGRYPIRQITAPQILEVLNRVADRGAKSVALNIRQWLSAIFRYGVATLRTDYDPVAALRGAIVRSTVINSEAMKKDELKELLLKLENYGGMRTTLLAMRLLIYTFVRTVEMRRGEWSEINLETALWVIPGEKMKKGRVHMVPLSRQALAIIQELRTLTGGGKNMFPNSRRPTALLCFSQRAAQLIFKTTFSTPNFFAK